VDSNQKLKHYMTIIDSMNDDGSLVILLFFFKAHLLIDVLFKNWIIQRSSSIKVQLEILEFFELHVDQDVPSVR
jgi:hypothetical protein